MKTATTRLAASSGVIFVLLFGAVRMAPADTISLVSSGGTTGHFDFTAYINRTINYDNSGYDQLDLDISAFTGPAIGYGIVAVAGTWSAPGSQGYTLLSDADAASVGIPWYEFTGTNAPIEPFPPETTYPLSTINLPAFFQAANWSRTRGTGTAWEFPSFTGTWFSTTALTGAPRLARLYAPTGWTPAPGAVIYSGALGFTYGGGTSEVSDLAVAPVAPEPGDANGDGRVDINDLTIVLTNFGKTGRVWSQGSMDGDPAGTVDINDLALVLANFGKIPGTAVAAPEPSTIALLLAGTACLFGFTRRRRRA